MQPRRVAAIGSSAVICLLSVSGALGLSPTGISASAAHHRSTSPGSGGTSVGGAHGRNGNGGGGPANPAQKPAHTSSTSPGGSTASPSQGTALPANSGTGKRVVFDVSAQRVWLVDADDTVERTYLVSGSKFHNLDLGTYHVASRSRWATAYNSNETMSYMVRFATGRTSPIGFHSIPVHPDGTLAEARSSLGTPQSDGCIRQWITDARALWEFAPDGTTVVVRA